jgi:hypothetical protein
VQNEYAFETRHKLKNPFAKIHIAWCAQTGSAPGTEQGRQRKGLPAPARNNVVENGFSFRIQDNATFATYSNRYFQV